MIKAFVMAAGAGTRLRPLTYETPKPMVPVVNRPVIHHVLDNLLRHGIKEVAVNLYAHADQIRGYCGDGSRWSLKIRYSHEAKLLGTAGAIKRMADFLQDDSFFVMSGDGISDIDLTDMLAFHRRHKSLATMAVKAVDSRFDYGVTITGRNGRIQGFLEKPLWSDVFSNKVNTGIYLFEPEILRYIPRGAFYDFGKQVWPKLLKQRKPIYAYDCKDYWTDIGNLQEYRRCQIDSLDRLAHINIPGSELRKGIWVEGGSSISPKAVLRAPCLIGKGCRIAAGAQIGPYTVVGDRATVAEKAVLKNCILFDNVTVGKDVHLTNCILGANGNVKENITVYEAAVINIRE